MERMANTDSEYQSTFEDPKDDPRLDEACFRMLELAEASRCPGDQIIVHRREGRLAAVIAFTVTERGEELGDLLERAEAQIAMAQGEGQPTTPGEAVRAALAERLEDEVLLIEARRSIEVDGTVSWEQVKNELGLE